MSATRSPSSSSSGAKPDSCDRRRRVSRPKNCRCAPVLHNGRVRASQPDLRRTFGPGELVRLLYRLGRHAANGVLTLSAPATRSEVLVLRRGAAVCADGELAKRALLARLVRAVA